MATSDKPQGQDYAVWAENHYSDIVSHSKNRKSAGEIVDLLMTDRRAEADLLLEQAEKEILRARAARDNHFDDAVRQLEQHADFLKSQARELTAKADAMLRAHRGR